MGVCDGCRERVCALALGVPSGEAMGWQPWGEASARRRLGPSWRTGRGGAARVPIVVMPGVMEA